MDEHDLPSTHFETHRTHLNGVAFRMLGSRSKAETSVSSWHEC